MGTPAFIFLGIFLLYFEIHFAWTQKIYSNNHFKFPVLLSITLPLIVFFISTTEYKFRLIHFSLIIIYYLLLLRLVKHFYKKLNGYFVNKKLISSDFLNKDFTYVLWDGDVPSIGDWWNENLARKPSWLDQIITILLFILPILLALLIYNFTKNGS